MKFDDKSRPLDEMASTCDNMVICIYDNEGPVPHFHIWARDAKHRDWETCIEFKSAKYFHHSGKEKVLNLHQRKELKLFFNRPYESKPTITNWQHAVDLWSDNNPEWEIDDIEMPDYTKL